MTNDESKALCEKVCELVEQEPFLLIVRDRHNTVIISNLSNNEIAHGFAAFAERITRPVPPPDEPA